ncbi:hypothetical protein [Streptomyces sp. NPDC127066]|uniref:hypothetical protein n=1 Tax=Streptomyces sp. NPDC127066 TaxID=3347125 RepID=UPI0036696DC0
MPTNINQRAPAYEAAASTVSDFSFIAVEYPDQALHSAGTDISRKGRRPSRLLTCPLILLLAGAPAVGADGYGARDAKVDDDVAMAVGLDSRVLLMVVEAYRHGKAVGAWSDDVETLASAGIALDAPGVVSADTADPALEQLTELLARHRAWDRFIPSV